MSFVINFHNYLKQEKEEEQKRLKKQEKKEERKRVQEALAAQLREVAIQRRTEALRLMSVLLARAAETRQFECFILIILAKVIEMALHELTKLNNHNFQVIVKNQIYSPRFIVQGNCQKLIHFR